MFVCVSTCAFGYFNCSVFAFLFVTVIVPYHVINASCGSICYMSTYVTARYCKLRNYYQNKNTMGVHSIVVVSHDQLQLTMMCPVPLRMLLYYVAKWFITCRYPSHDLNFGRFCYECTH